MIILDLLVVGLLAPISTNDLKLLKAIATIESRGNPKAINKQSWDYGLLQINHKTANRYGKFAFQMLDKHQNVEIALKVLKEHHKRFGHEPTWACRYNVGTARRVSHWNSCRKYFYKLLKAGYVTNIGLKETK